ncbi:MAG TPA: hypothetical protein VLN48_02790 [Bryobacteraceae bacterium]|nr:hypothetical protein [Bryobacteraceae bacterium]
MRIDRTHRPWVMGTGVVFLAALIGYAAYAVRTPGGPRGGTAIGLAFGVAGYAVMLFEGLLGVRKKVPIWRLGRAQTWMRGHLWLGILTLPLILFHAGFAFRGPLTAVLMALLVIVVASGVAGAILQHYLPRLITTRVPMETIYEEIPHVRAQLRDEAEQLVTALAVEAEHDDKVRFREAYAHSIRPFLEAPETAASPLFESLRRTTPAAFHPALDDLENICQEELQLSRQRRLYHWLHAWLLVHVPLSVALLLLGGIHAVMALRY